MEEFLIRVITEQNELYDKLTKLNRFIETEKFKSLDDENQRLLKMQSSFSIQVQAKKNLKNQNG